MLEMQPNAKYGQWHPSPSNTTGSYPHRYYEDILPIIAPTLWLLSCFHRTLPHCQSWLSPRLRRRRFQRHPLAPPPKVWVKLGCIHAGTGRGEASPYGPGHCVALMLFVSLPRRYYCALRNGSVRHLKHEHSQYLWLRSGRLLHSPSLDRPSFLVLGFNFTTYAVVPSPRTCRSHLHATASWLVRRVTCLVTLTAIVYNCSPMLFQGSWLIST